MPRGMLCACAVAIGGRAGCGGVRGAVLFSFLLCLMFRVSVVFGPDFTFWGPNKRVHLMFQNSGRSESLGLAFHGPRRRSAVAKQTPISKQECRMTECHGACCWHVRLPSEVGTSVVAFEARCCIHISPVLDVWSFCHVWPRFYISGAQQKGQPDFSKLRSI